MQEGEFPVGGNGGGVEVVRGQIKWFNAVKGFGFVKPDDGSGDVFLHLTCLRDYGRDSVAEGTTIECEVAQRAKGKQAVRILTLDPSTAQEGDGGPRGPGGARGHGAGGHGAAGQGPGGGGYGGGPEGGWNGRPPRREGRFGDRDRGGYDPSAHGAEQPDLGYGRAPRFRDGGDDVGMRGSRPPQRRVAEVVPEGEFMSATVKWFNPIRGYGFVLCQQYPQDVFLHMEVLRRAGVRDLQPGQEIEIRVGQGPKGLQVAEVRVSA